MLAVIGKIVDHIFSYRIVSTVVASIFLSLTLTATVGFSLKSIAISFAPPYLTIIDREIITTIYISCLFVFVILIYFLTLREREDILTPLRKKLKGIWRVNYQIWKHDQHGKVIEDSVIEVCVIGIDISTAKLYFYIKTDAAGIYEGGEFRIDDITINPYSSPKRLTYYYNTSIRLKDEVRDKLGLKDSTLTFPVFGILNIIEENKEPKSSYEKMTGYWYDLEGIYSNVLEATFKAKNDAEECTSLPRKGLMTFERVHEEQD